MIGRSARGVFWTVATLFVSGTTFSAEMTTRRWGTPPAGPPSKKATRPRGKPPTCYVVRTASPPKLDGTLDDAAWKASPAYALARTLDGAGGAPQPTEVRLLRDAKTLYVAFRCTEPLGGKLVASRRGHDGPIWEDDSVEMFLGPAGGAYYHFGVNAMGSTYDAAAKDRSWNSQLTAAAGREDGAWTVELAVPLAKMLGEAKAPTRWVANFNRNRRATGRWQETAWSPTYSGDSHVPGRFGRMLFESPPAGTSAVRPARAVKTDAVEVLPAAGGAGVVRFDLSALPAGAAVYRADLLVFRTTRVDGRMPASRIEIDIRPLSAPFASGARPAGVGKKLSLRAPWFDRFDATEAVRQAAKGRGPRRASFFVKACPFWNAEATCLLVAHEGRPAKLPPQVTDLAAFHRSGQTFVTFKEIDDPVGRDEIAWGELKRILDELDARRRVRYCVFRHVERITAGTLHEAELLATVRPLSCWNVTGRNVDRPVDEFLASGEVLMTGHWNPFRDATVDGPYGRDCPIDRLVIRDGAKPLPRGRGLYVHTARRDGRAYYAVVTSVDGAQNTIDLSPANALTKPIDERVAEPRPVLQRELPKMPFFNFDQKRLHYVRWVAPPLANVPMQVHNWSVGVPRRLGQAVPLELSLHRDGHSYWRTQYRIERDSIVLSPYDFPIQSWWCGYHESLGTLKSFATGAIQPYTQRRLLSFVRWARAAWPVDAGRVLVTGCRGGASGSGALHLAVSHPEVFSLTVAGHPVIDYADASRRTDRHGVAAALSMQAVWGHADWQVPGADGKSFYAAHDLNAVLAALPAAAELPFMALSSNHGNATCRKFYEIMLRRRGGIMAEFSWGGARYVPVSASGTYPNVIRLDIRRDRPLLAFASAQAWKYATQGGMGDFNRHFRWRDVVDAPARFEATVFTHGRGDNVADITPRRLVKFKPAPGKAYAWKTVSPDRSAKIQAGEATAGDSGLLTLKGVKLSAEPARLTVTPK